MSIQTKDRGATIAAGSVELVDADDANVRASGITHYRITDTGVIQLRLVQPCDIDSIVMLHGRNDSVGGTIVAGAEVDGPEWVEYSVFDDDGDPDKTGLFWFAIYRMPGVEVPIEDP